RSELLKSAGVANAAEAHALLSKRRDLEAERKAVLTQLKALKVENNLEAAIGQLKTDLAETDAAIITTLADTQRECLPTAEEMEEEALAWSQERTTREARRDNLGEVHASHQQALETAVSKHSRIESKLELLRKSVAEDLALCPDSERAARHAALIADVA